MTDADETEGGEDVDRITIDELKQKKIWLFVELYAG